MYGSGKYALSCPYVWFSCFPICSNFFILILKENIVNTLDAFVTSLSVSFCHCVFDLQPEDAVRGLS